MHTPSEALALVLGRVATLSGTEAVPLAHAAGRVLAEPAHADGDLPAFRRSMMDGFAVRSADFGGPRLDDGSLQLACVGESRAGAPFEGPFGGAVQAGTCVEIYTGAVVPDDCDAVVVVERTARQANRVRIAGAAPRPGEHVQEAGALLASGARVFEAGRRLSPVDLSVLASCGVHPVVCHPRPRVAVLTTGDELVPPWVRPERGQLREGNTLFLAARCQALDVEVVEVGIVPDDAELLEREFRAALERSDVLVTTGGVSMGRYDLVGRAFEAIGVEPVLHKVAVKPGKPIWFGMRGAQPVLGLPGNPVSSLLGLELFVRPVLAKLGGETGAAVGERLLPGVWDGAPPPVDERQQNLPCRLAHGDDARARLVPLPWRGSSDVVTVAAAQALAVVPPGATVERGAVIRYRPLA